MSDHAEIITTCDTLGIYLSIPFCKSKCSFCNFASGVFAMESMQGYLNCLCGELRAARSRAEELGAHLPSRVDTVYLGGGTPSLLDPKHLRQVFATLRSEFDLDKDAEITLEAAPGQLAAGTLDAAMQLGVNRVSLGVQSFIDRESAAVGRLHTGPECHAEIMRLHAAGVEKVSLDLIAGLPYQTPESWTSSVSQAIDTGAGHVSVYLLEVDEDSRLGREALSEGTRYHAPALPSDDAAADCYQTACAQLAGAGVDQYEISNFAREGSSSRHNLKYWNRHPYLGAGLDAHSMLLCSGGAGDDASAAVRLANVSDMVAYLAQGRAAADRSALTILPVREHQADGEIHRIGIDQAFEESFFLGLRLNRGVDLDRLRKEFGVVRVAVADPALIEVESAGLIQRHGSRVSLTPPGRLASNEVFSRLLVA